MCSHIFVFFAINTPTALSLHMNTIECYSSGFIGVLMYSESLLKTVRASLSVLWPPGGFELQLL